jgi:DNA ligase (NAD+)
LLLPTSREIGFFGKSESPLDPLEEKLGWIVGDKSPEETQWRDLKAFLETEHKMREDLEYEIDGIVIKVNDLKLREAMGNTAHHPRWAMALKFGFQEGETRVLDLTIQVGRTGRITPLALVEPVTLAGATIQRVTLHNQAYIDELGLKRGDQVLVSRRGDVIPAVERVTHSASGEVWHIPTHCPECGTELVLVGAHHFCPNEECPARLKAQLTFFVGRKQMDISTLSEATIELLFDKGFIRHEGDLYHLDSAQVEKLEGMGKRKVEQLQLALQKSLSQPFERLMVSLGLREMGAAVIRLLEEAGYRSFQDYVALAEDPTGREKLLSIKGIGEKLAESFKEQILSPSLQSRVEALKGVGFSFQSKEPKREVRAGILAGQVWCVTGALEHFENREQVETLLRSLGAKVVSSVTQELTHLLVGEKAGKKREQALKKGVSCVSEKEFWERIQETQNS